MRFVQVGLGYRARALKSVLRQLGEFDCVGLVLPKPRPAPLPVFTDLATCLRATAPDLVVCLTISAATPARWRAAITAQVPVLAQTPLRISAASVAAWRQVADCGLVQLANYQRLLPGHAAGLAAVGAGLIGPVSEVQVSGLGPLQALQLIRAYLGVDVGTPAQIASADWGSNQAMLRFDFGAERVGIYEYQPKRDSSPIGEQRLLVRGAQGELSGSQLIQHHPANLITNTHFQRHHSAADPTTDQAAADQIILGDHLLWTNPWPDRGWDDAQIAAASGLTQLSAWLAHQADPPYQLSEALYDAELALGRSAQAGEEVGFR